MMKQFCPFCDDIVDVEMIGVEEPFPVKKDTVLITAQLYKCSVCSNTFVDDRLEEINYQGAVEIYKKKHRLLFPSDIVGIREQYGLSQRQFSRLLGWSEATLCRYERGKVQEASHNDELVLLQVPSNMQLLLDKNRGRVSEKEEVGLRARLAKLVADQMNSLEVTSLDGLYDDVGVGRLTGNVKFTTERFQAVVLHILSQGELFKTKLLKLLFYSDFCHYRRHSRSITGTKYVALEYGPVPDGFERILAHLHSRRMIHSQYRRFADGVEGEIICADTAPNMTLLSEVERGTIDYVVDHFRTYSAARISDESHGEAAYVRAKGNGPLDYADAKDLKLT